MDGVIASIPSGEEASAWQPAAPTSRSRLRASGLTPLGRSVLERVGQAAILLDGKGRPRFWNRAAAVLLGVPDGTAPARLGMAQWLEAAARLDPAARAQIASHCLATIRGRGPEAETKLRVGDEDRMVLRVGRVGDRPLRWLLLADPIPARSADGADPGLRDALTGLASREQFDRLVASALRRPPSGALAVLLLDLDRFGLVNEALGHSVDDALLRRAAERIARTLRGDALAARFGGSQFAVLLFDGAGADGLAARLADALGRPYVVQGHVLTIGVSIGVALSPPEGCVGEELVRNAGLALAEAKAAGGNGRRFFDAAMDHRARDRRALEADLRRSIERAELDLRYQPQLDLRTYAIAGFEALPRWDHPARGMVPPETFLPVAEETGFVGDLSEWVLRTACAEAARWERPVAIAVNVSPREVQDGARLCHAVRAALDASGLAPGRLELEITESALQVRGADALATLRALHAIGVRISLDDFGTGYSSLTHLRSFPFDKIKVAPGVVRDMGSSRDALAVLRAVAALGAAMGVRTAAGGVETDAQASLIAADGYTDIQGGLVGGPICSAAVPGLIRSCPGDPGYAAPRL